MTRTGNSTVIRLTPADVSGTELSLQGAHDDVAARAQCADDAKASALVGIYFDAGGSEQNAGMVTAYDADRPFSAANLTLANLVQNDVLTRMNAQGWAIPNDGVLTDDTLGSVSGDPDSGGLAAAAADYDHLMLIGPSMAGYFSTPSDHARRGDRTAVHHRSLRRVDRRQRRRATGDRPRHRHRRRAVPPSAAPAGAESAVQASKPVS